MRHAVPASAVVRDALAWPCRWLALLLAGRARPGRGLHAQPRSHRQRGAAGEGRFTDADINVIENLGQRVPEGLSFQDGRGQRVELDACSARASRCW